MTNVLRGELLKIRTTNTWWLYALGIVALTSITFLFNAIGSHFELHPQLSSPPPDAPAADRQQVEQDNAHQLAEAQLTSTLIRVAANLYTSGQFFGALLVMLLGAMIVTNEFAHQTATATFLTTPHRTTVIIAKLFAAIAMATFFWLLTTVLDVVAGAIFLPTQHRGNGLGYWAVDRTILLNLAAYAAWAVLGVGLGVLLRSQIGAVATGAVVYLVGTLLASIVFNLVHEYLIKKDWVLTAQVLLPAIASTVMVTVGRAFEHAPPQWVGAVVLIGWGVLFGVAGTLITRKRDIS
jgi:ABC-type transport system involved in multi-copper enzyme maturation permease subunit